MTTLEEAFRQIRSENSKYSIKVIELEREIVKLKLEVEGYQKKDKEIEDLKSKVEDLEAANHILKQALKHQKINLN